MNLNPLKKDDNTDALVQALEDANNMDAVQAAPPVTDDPAGLQQPVTSDNSLLAADDPLQAQVPEPEQPLPTPEVAVDAAAPLPEPVTEPLSATDSTAALSFDGNDLPAGLTVDAPLPATDVAPEPVAVTPEVPIEAPALDPAPMPVSNLVSGDGELDDVKKDALNQLRPLIEKLNLEPADKFDKYLMMLRASDDPALIKPAFDAAQGILGEKEKAQALLDIINEINYITANHQQ